MKGFNKGDKVRFWFGSKTVVGEVTAVEVGGMWLEFEDEAGQESYVSEQDDVIRKGLYANLTRSEVR